MDGQKPEAVEEQSHTENPEDVAVLYSWANLQGARYRDFSGARRESRALMRHRAAEEAKDAESRAQAEAEAAATAAERAAREASIPYPAGRHPTSTQNVRLCGKPLSRADGQLTVQIGGYLSA